MLTKRPFRIIEALNRPARAALSLLLAAAALVVVRADPQPPAPASVLERFLSRTDPPPSSYRALRHLEAESPRFGARGWMDAWTEVGPGRFDITIAAEGGSGYVRSKVLKAALEGERKMFLAGDPAKAALTRDNYSFDAVETVGEGLSAIALTPLRKDILLVNGRVTVKEIDADMVRVEGRLSKTPSFWTRRVEVDRRYDRIEGIRVPVSISSVAQVLLAGRSTFRMSYEYESINGKHVGDPKVRTEDRQAKN